MTASKAADPKTGPGDGPVYETLTVRTEGAVLFADISAPPMNLLGPELVRDLVALIQRAEADNAVGAHELVYVYLTHVSPQYRFDGAV